MGFQVSTFLSTNPNIPTDALYILEGGNNDILDAALAPGATAADVLAAEQQAVLNLATEVAFLAGAGARDFLLFDVGALERTPEFQSSPLNGAIAAASQQFRTDLTGTILPLEVAYGVEIAMADLYGLSEQVQTNPGAFGFTNVKDSARDTGAANPDTYFYWDELHPTTKADNLIAEAALQSIDATFAPQVVPEPASASLVEVIFLLLATLCLKHRKAIRDL